MTDTAPLSIAFVMSSFEPGGTERQMIELIRRLDRKRWNVHVACLRETGAWRGRVLESATCEAFPITSFKRPSTLDRLRDFAAWCRARQFAVVHAVDLPSNIFGLPGAALAGVPVRIGTRRDINPGRTVFEQVAQRAAYGCAHVVVANAEAAADRLRFEGIAGRRIRVVPNGLDTGQFRQCVPSLRPRKVIAVANLRPEKGQDVLIEAAVQVTARFPDARFELAGGGTERARLAAMVHERGLSGAVTFTGHVEDVPSYLAASDIFVLPSRTEAFPNAVLEAMAAGLPVVASRVGGVPEVIDDGRSGVLVPPGNAPALADALERLMADPARTVRLGAEARRVVRARFSFERMVDGFESVYVDELIRRGVVSAPRTQLAAS